MGLQIVRTPDEIESAYNRAQAETFAAEDAGLTADEASAQYQLLRWLAGHEDTDPTIEYDGDFD